MKGFIFLLYLCLPTALVVASPIEITDHTIGQKLSFNIEGSKHVLNTSFWIPDTQNKQSLPLLVVLDGQRYFAYATSMHHMMQQYGWTPPFAILGINVDKGRWPTYMQRRELILQTLATKVFPFLEKNHGIGKERMLFGWESAGGFVIRALRDNADLFSSYIAASPSPLYGKYFPTYKQDHQSMLVAFANQSQQTHLYLAQGSYDYPQYLGLQTLVEGLKNHASANLRWHFQQIDDASHASLGFETLMFGVKDYFYYYDKPRFSSHQDFINKGGYAYLDEYFKQQAKIYGFNQLKIANNRFKTLRKISFYMLMDNDLQAFQQFLATLKDTDFLAKSHLNHIYSYADFLLQAGDVRRGKELFHYIQQRHPENARPVYGLGMVAVAEKKFAKARTFFSQAIELATTNQDFRLAEYQQSLSKLPSP